MRVTPTKVKMNIALLSIPFAGLAIAVATVPLLVAMKQQSKSRTTSAPVAPTVRIDARPVDTDKRELEHAA